MAHHHAGQKIFIFLRSRSRFAIAALLAQHRLYSLKRFFVDQWLMLHMVNFAIVFKFTSVHSAPQYLIDLGTIWKSPLIFFLNIGKPNAARPIYSYNMLKNLFIIR